MQMVTMVPGQGDNQCVSLTRWAACPPPGDLPDPGTEPASFMSPA